MEITNKNIKSNNSEDISNKQIEEMADIIEDSIITDNMGYITHFDTDETAEALYNAGYRKERHGEWIDTGDFELDNIYSGWKCSLCGHIFCGNKTNYCSNCGAHMKGE